MRQFQIENVSVVIDKKKLLHNMSLSLKQGEMLALVGHNGAGKSTLMNAITGSINKSSGKMTILNKYDQDKDVLQFKRRVSYLPEEPLLLTELTVMQHFQLYGMSYQLSKELLDERIKRLTKGFDLEAKLNEYPESLSKGMRQKTQAICALLPDVPVLLIDEPFIGLDIYAVEFLLSLIREKLAQGTSILLTTHQLDMLKDIANRFVLLKHGEIELTGEIDSFETITRGFNDD